MKILGIDNSNYSKKYIVHISEDEIHNIFNLSYNSSQKAEYKIGEEVEIDSGYKFFHEIKNLVESFKSSNDKFLQANKTMCRFLELFQKEDKSDS